MNRHPYSNINLNADAMGRYSFATAAGMFKTLVSVALLIAANWIVRKMGEDRLF